MKEKLDELEKAVTELNADTDTLNEAIRDFEDKLAAMGVGIEAWVTTETVLGWQIGYAKVDGKWCLVARGRNTDPQPLTKMPRRVRAEATEKFERLLELLLASVKSHHHVVRVAITNAKKVL